MNLQQKKMKGFVHFSAVLTIFMATLLGVVASEKLSAQEQTGNTTTEQAAKAADTGMMKGLGLIGAGIAFGLATLGAGVGIGSASSAAIGALSEKPSMFGISLVFVALCEGLVIFGFVIAAMIMGRI